MSAAPIATSPDTRLDTISMSLGNGVQVQSSKSPRPAYYQPEQGPYHAATGLRIGIFVAAYTDEDGQHAAESADLYFDRARTDELVQALQQHRARMEPNPVAPLPSRLDFLVAAVQALLPSVESEIEQRKTSGLEEDYAELEQLLNAVKGALP